VEQNTDVLVRFPRRQPEFGVQKYRSIDEILGGLPKNPNKEQKNSKHLVPLYSWDQPSQSPSLFSSTLSYRVSVVTGASSGIGKRRQSDIHLVD